MALQSRRVTRTTTGGNRRAKSLPSRTMRCSGILDMPAAVQYTLLWRRRATTGELPLVAVRARVEPLANPIRHETGGGGHRRMRKIASALLIVGALVLGSAVPASAAIHEKVAKFCSGGHGNLDPGGQEAFGRQSFLRALQATKMYDIQIGVVPAGEPAPAAGTTPVTVNVDYSRPMSKFDAAGFYVVFVDSGFTVYLWAPDLANLTFPAFLHCPHLDLGAP